MAYIPLNRQFERIPDNAQPGADVARHMRGSLSWSDLLRYRRVVILAEAGSGKSAELRAQHAALSSAAKYSFYATLQDIGELGLERALGRAQSEALRQWQSADQPGWLFLDSVDEAKASRLKLPRLLREVSDAIAGKEGMAHIVLSGRVSDWEPQRDLAALNEMLPLPPEDKELPPVEPDDLLIQAIRNKSRREERKAEPVEGATVTIMAALDRTRVDIFARGMGVSNVDAFLRALDDADLWMFAKRPVDLGWMVEYWHAQGQFSRLASMLDICLRERLKETDSARRREDPLNAEDSMEALERIGAAFVLGKLDSIIVPDNERIVGTADQRGLNLSQVLPDWPPANTRLLLNRAVFEPANSGFVRLHNDNESNVRAYLAAKWMKRLLDSNAPFRTVSRLLFADTYGVPLIRPTMRTTAAWLALWDNQIAHLVLERDPWLLLTAGDPGSLPLPIRKTVLERAVRETVRGSEIAFQTREAFKRFATADMADVIRSLWHQHVSSDIARELLLNLIEAGHLVDCRGIVAETVRKPELGDTTLIFAGRALLATAQGDELTQYGTYIRDNAVGLPAGMIWDAIDALFPQRMTVKDLIAIVPRINANSLGGDMGLQYLGPKLVRRIAGLSDVTELINSLQRLEGADQAGSEHGDPEENPYTTTLEAAACRMFELSPDGAPPALAIDVALRLGEWRRSRGTRTGEQNELVRWLSGCAQARRATLWQASAFLAKEKSSGPPLTNPLHLQFLGIHLTLGTPDIAWLINDLKARVDPAERRLAANSLMLIWRQDGEPAELRATIEDLAREDALVAEVVSAWTVRPAPTPAEKKLERRIATADRKNAIARAKADQSWKDFAQAMRADPDQLSRIGPPVEAGIDSRLYHFWVLLNSIGENRNRYAISDLTPLVPMFGTQVVDGLRGAFIRYWRHWTPIMSHERPPGQRNQVRHLDLIGLVGVTQEAALDPSWATKLTDAEAGLAAKYATLELNGYPKWFPELAREKPAPVRDVLSECLREELLGTTNDHPEELYDIAAAGAPLAQLAAGDVFDAVREGRLAGESLRRALDILYMGFSDRGLLLDTVLTLSAHTDDLNSAAHYLAAGFAIDASTAMPAVRRKLSALASPDAADFFSLLLPRLFGNDWEDRGVHLATLTFSDHEELVRMAYRYIRTADDLSHPTGRVYSPGKRDFAESARDSAFKLLVGRPGRATFEAIMRMVGDTDFPKERTLRKLAWERAGQDSESPPWSADEVRAFERDFNALPKTGADLQRVLIGRLEDLQDELIHGDYTQGRVLARLPLEVDVQNWFADRLRSQQGRSYSVEREPHVADEKEPDIRARAKATDANVPIEIKVADSWSFTEMEFALTGQLQGRYLRDPNAKFGILLAIHQDEAKKKHWLDADNQAHTFAELVQHLNNVAGRIASTGVEAAQMVVIGIDVSRFRSPEAKQVDKKAGKA